MTIPYRVTTIHGEGEAVIRVEGELDAAAGASLIHECESTSGSIRLDLSGLNGADDDGIDVLQALVRRGVRLVGATPYIRTRLAARR